MWPHETILYVHFKTAHQFLQSSVAADCTSEGFGEARFIFDFSAKDTLHSSWINGEHTIRMQFRSIKHIRSHNSRKDSPETTRKDTSLQEDNKYYSDATGVYIYCLVLVSCQKALNTIIPCVHFSAIPKSVVSAAFCTDRYVPLLKKHLASWSSREVETLVLSVVQVISTRYAYSTVHYWWKAMALFTTNITILGNRTKPTTNNDLCKYKSMLHTALCRYFA